MTKNVKILIVVAVMLSLVSALIADNNHNKPYLRMGLGAKGMAMGGTGTAYMNDITAAYWNPAGLSKVTDFEVGIDYTDGLGLDRVYNNASVGMRYKYGYIALSWINAGTTDIDSYDDSENYLGEYDVMDNNVNLSLATRYGSIHWGATLKMLFDDIDGDQKSGYGLDLGAIYDINEYMSAGIMVRDLVSDFDDSDIPTQYSVGVAVYPIHGLTVSGDFRKEESADESTVHVGAEYWTSIGGDSDTGSSLGTMRNTENPSWEDMLSEVQGGVRVGANDGNFTAGFGIRFKMVEMNYAFVKADDDGINEDTHRYGLTFRF